MWKQHGPDSQGDCDETTKPFAFGRTLEAINQAIDDRRGRGCLGFGIGGLRGDAAVGPAAEDAESNAEHPQQRLAAIVIAATAPVPAFAAFALIAAFTAVIAVAVIVIPVLAVPVLAVAQRFVS
ncbi:MAG: hypothetical protein J4F38_04145 [Pseudomonadales bacterium]|nr:hypothetical protein [Pseudomonadales bacterium]